MTPKQLAELERLAAIKAQRELAKLAEIRARKAREERRAAQSRQQAADTFDATPESADELRMLYHMREAALARAQSAHAAAARIAGEEALAHDAARLEKGRELALAEMTARARLTLRKKMEKRAEAASSALLNLRLW